MLLDRKRGHLLEAGTLSLSCCPLLGHRLYPPKGQTAQKGQLVHETHQPGLGTCLQAHENGLISFKIKTKKYEDIQPRVYSCLYQSGIKYNF